MTRAQLFIDKAKAIMPHQDELQNLDPKIDNYNTIDEIMFHKGEYLGGMAAVIIQLIKNS